MTWTKEQLKTLAGSTPSATISNSTLPYFSQSTPISDEEDIAPKKRNFTARAIPKAIFAAVIVAPAFACAYLFMNGNLSSSQKVSEQTKDVDEKTQQLQEQLAASQAQLDEAQAKLAAVRQERSRTNPIREEKTNRSVKKVKTESNSSRPRIRKTYSPPPVRQVAPVRQTLVRPQTVRTPQIVEPTVYGAGAIGVELASSEVETVVAQDNQPQESEFSDSEKLTSPSSNYENLEQKENSKQLTDEIKNETVTVDSDLEASLVQEQPLVKLNAGRQAKAFLSVPFVRYPDSEEQVVTHFTISLNEPLIAQTGDIVFPIGTTILVKAEPIESADIVEFVAVEAYLPSSQKIPLPEGAIRFSDPDGQPIVTRSIESDSGDSEEDESDLLDEIERVIEVGGSVEDVLSGDRALRGATDTLTDVRDLIEDDGEFKGNRVLYLPAETEVKLYVAKDLIVPLAMDASDMSAGRDEPILEIENQFFENSQPSKLNSPDEKLDPNKIDFFINYDHNTESALFF